MQKNIYIIDANIAVKLLFEEQDSDIAHAFFVSVIQEDHRLFVPDHFLYELMNVSLRLKLEAKDVLELFQRLQSMSLTVVTPQSSIWLLAEKICKDGHPKSGFPSIYDSIYHALAIELEGIFVTADKRHFEKTKHWQHMKLLSEIMHV